MINTVAGLMLRLKSDRRGVTALEYGLLASLIGLAIVAAVTTFATDLSAMFTTIGGKL
jgi:pilus assembly protein Flp/PilA